MCILITRGIIIQEKKRHYREVKFNSIFSQSSDQNLIMHLQCIRFQLMPSSKLTVFQGQFCDYCNAADPRKAHPITNAIDGTERWWQSPPLSMGLKYNEVNVTLDLGQVSV